MPVTIRIAKDTDEERVLVERDICKFSVSDRFKSKAPGNDFLFYVSTKENIAGHQELADWKMILNAGSSGIKRFGVNCSLEKLIHQLGVIYGQNDVELVKC